MNFLFFAAAGTILLLLAVLYRQFRLHAGRHELLIRLETTREAQRQQIETLEKEIQELEARLTASQEAYNTAKQAEKLALQRLEIDQQVRREWEKQREEFEKAARSSVMAAGHELSSKLLADHKREAEELKQKLEVKNQQREQQALQQFKALTESVAAIREMSVNTQKQSDILLRTMSSPNSAGQLTEVALENLLKNMGLQPNVDFKMQYTVSEGEGSNLRPDCVIYLPHDRLMIIDCKASKHQLELAAAEGEEEYALAKEKFRSAMLRHLEMLAKKEYAKAICDEYRQKTGNTPQRQLMNVMYIASDAAIERLDEIDPIFREKMQKAGIIPAGPTGLHGLCTIASMHISEARKAENQERILHEIERILGGLAVGLGHLEKLGNSLKSAANHFGSFTGSYNRTLAPKLRQLEKLGVKSESKKRLPERLPTYEVRNREDFIELEATAEESNNVTSLEDSRKEKESA